MTEPDEFEGLVQRNLAASCSFSFVGFAALLHHILVRNVHAALAHLSGGRCTQAEAICGDQAPLLMEANALKLHRSFDSCWQGLKSMPAQQALKKLEHYRPSSNRSTCRGLQSLLHNVVNLKRIAQAMQELLLDMPPASKPQQQVNDASDCADQLQCAQLRIPSFRDAAEHMPDEMHSPEQYHTFADLSQAAQVCEQDIGFVNRSCTAADTVQVDSHEGPSEA